MIHGDRLRRGGCDAAELLVINQLGDRRVCPAHRAVEIFSQLQLAEPHPQRVVNEEPPDQRFANPHNQLHRFGGLNHSNQAGQDTKHAAFGAARNESRRRRFGIEAAIAGTVLRRKYGGLALESKDAAVRVWLPEQNAGIVDEIPRRKVVRSVDDDVVRFEQLHRVLRRQRHFVGLDVDLGVERMELVLRRREFRTADVRRAVEDLPLQIAEIDGIEVDDAKRADAGRREVHRHRRSQSAGADAEDLGGFELALTFDADLRHDQVSRVAFDLVVGQAAFAALRLRRVHCSLGGGGHTARDRRDDAHGVGRVHRRLFFLEIPDVFVVHVDVDEAAQLSLIVEEVRFEPGMPARQVGQQLANGRAAGVDRVLLIRVRSERGRDENFRHGEDCPLQKSNDRP